MSEKIVSRSFSKQGLDNWDKIFKKTKKVIKDQKVNPMISKQPTWICDECEFHAGDHTKCQDYIDENSNK